MIIFIEKYLKSNISNGKFQINSYGLLIIDCINLNYIDLINSDITIIPMTLNQKGFSYHLGEKKEYNFIRLSCVILRYEVRHLYLKLNKTYTLK